MITLTHELAAPLPRVWQAWTTASSLCAWDPDRIDGEIRAGKSYVMHWDSLGASLEVRVVALREEEELHLRSEREDGSRQELRVHLRALRSDCTALTLHISGAPGEDERLGTAAGWYTQLRILERYLLLRPDSRTSFAAFGTAIVPLERAYEALSHPGAWLSREEMHLEAEGQPYAMSTRPDVDRASLTLSGEVLSLSFGRELACWCSELGGVIRLRALPLAAGRARLLGVQVIRWGETDNALAIEDALYAGVERLIDKLGGPNGNA